MFLETAPPRPRRATAAAAALALGLALLGTAPALAQSPQVLDVAPTFSPTQGGARMTIMGLDFGAAAGTVQIGDRHHVVAAGDWTPTQIQLDIPEGEPGPTLLRVRRPSGHVSNVWQGFSYEPPQLTRFSPDDGPARGGVLITIHGANFGTAATEKVVRMGGKIALCQRISHEELQFTLPNLPPGTQVDGWVEVNGLATGTSAFSVDAPIVSDVSPMPGPTQGGLLVTITGSNFGVDGEDAAPIVDISGELCTVMARVSDSEIQALTAPGSGGSRPLTVRVGTGQPGPAFEYAYQPPYVGATDPAPGPAYSSFPITIHGSNFGPPGTAVEALLHSPHGTGTTVIQCNPTDHFQAVGLVPPLAPGTYALEMFVVDQYSQPVPYVIGGTPVISSYGPTNGPTEGGTRITIFGEHFGGVPVAVHLGPWECFIDTWTDNTIECYTPPGYGGTFFEMRVQGPGGEESNPGYFQYDSPQLLEVDPMFLNPAGGQVITLRGENFGIQGAPLLVDFSGVPASIAQWVSHHEVRVTTPPGEPNQVGLVCVRMGPAGEEVCEDFQYGNPVAVEPPPLPVAFGLRLAGANPSRGPTAFAVDLPRDARWRLHVFDPAGRLVRRFEGEAPAGTHPVTWDGTDARGARVPRGLYWARLEVAGETFVRKAMRL